MKTLAIGFGLVVLGFRIVQAADAPLIEEKNQSHFTIEENARNPFWPIGWKPPARGADQAGPEIPASAFLVSSITLDPAARFAIINGKPMKEGQQFGLQMGNQTYQLTLKAIEDGQVVLLRRDQEIIVPLHRK
jgi:hypothetical protein